MEHLAETGGAITTVDDPSGAPGAWRSTRVRRARARIDRVSLALPMALLIGVAMAFALFAAPVRWPAAHVLPRDAVRLLIAFAGGSLAALPVWALFRRLERPLRPARVRPAPALAVDTPTLRRADAHPDAPPRRPIFAAADLGPPLDTIEPIWTPSPQWGGTAEPTGPTEPDLMDGAAFGAMPAEGSPRASAVTAGSADTPPPAAGRAPSPAPSPAPGSAPPASSARDNVDPGSAASLLARLEAALIERTTEAGAPGATAAVRRGALDELRRIGKRR